MAKLPVTFPFELPVAVNTTLWPVEEGKHDGAGTKLKLATFTAVPLPWVRFIENAKAGDPSGLFRPAPQNPLMFHVRRELPHAPNISTSPDKTATRICFIAGFRLQTAIFYAGAGASSKRKRPSVAAQFEFPHERAAVSLQGSDRLLALQRKANSARTGRFINRNHTCSQGLARFRQVLCGFHHSDGLGLSLEKAIYPLKPPEKLGFGFPAKQSNLLMPFYLFNLCVSFTKNEHDRQFLLLMLTRNPAVTRVRDIGFTFQ